MVHLKDTTGVSYFAATNSSGSVSLWGIPTLPWRLAPLPSREAAPPFETPEKMGREPGTVSSTSTQASSGRGLVLLRVFLHQRVPVFCCGQTVHVFVQDASLEQRTVHRGQPGSLDHH